jgi:hypothetical protein
MFPTTTKLSRIFVRFSVFIFLTQVGCVEDRNASSETKTDTGPRVVTESDGGGDLGPATCLPETEKCDDTDNDCDGEVDEGFSLGQVCQVETGGCVSEGMWRCNAENGIAICVAPDPEPVDEMCDEVDNDCDGEVDEGINTQANVAHCGACNQACAPPNAVPRCIDAICAIGRCDVGFEDVNRIPDDGCECQYQNQRVEVCNGIDDDCDGTVDEGFGLGNMCTVGLGLCQVTGMVVCGADGDHLCDGIPAVPNDEICNGRDDDCDGLADEEFDRDEDGAILCPDLDCEAPCPDGFYCRLICEQRDCNDGDVNIGPFASEICGDGIDQNCDEIDAPCAVRSGRIVEFTIVAAGMPGCRDIDGNGEIDNAFGALAGLINPQLRDEIGANRLNLFALIYGIEDSDVVARFELAIVYAVNGRIQAATLDENGQPINLFPGARLNRGQLDAGPRPFLLQLPLLGGDIIELLTQSARLTGSVTIPAEANGFVGVRVQDGLLTAGLDKMELRRAINLVAPDFVGLVDGFEADLDLNGDGLNESLGLCARFEVQPMVASTTRSVMV